MTPYWLSGNELALAPIHTKTIYNPFNFQVLLLHVELEGNSYICKALGR